MNAFVSPDVVRSLFAQAMSDMYRAEVPLYAELLQLVAQVNADTLRKDAALAAQIARNDELKRIDLERHGAIRVGTAAELSMLRRLFAVMGMFPVAYYDLSVAGVPVHSTAFRPLDAHALAANPFRVFCSLLRLELIEDAALRRQAETILSKRDIFTFGARELIAQAERDGGLNEGDAQRFVAEALETFRWHRDATVSLQTYAALGKAHKLIADVVSFRGPHINHLTPRTLDLDAAQAEMLERGIKAKAVIEGPPRRKVPILLRQTSFTALNEAVDFPDGNGTKHGSHTARFGEIEQRGIALTPKGRALYDACLAKVRTLENSGSASDDYQQKLAAAFADFPDTLDELRAQELGYFRYAQDANGATVADPIVYEDFLPVSAAGIFQSNLGGAEQRAYAAHDNQQEFEAALGARVNDPFALYAALQERSLAALRAG